LKTNINAVFPFVYQLILISLRCIALLNLLYLLCPHFRLMIKGKVIRHQCKSTSFMFFLWLD